MCYNRSVSYKYVIIHCQNGMIHELCFDFTSEYTSFNHIKHINLAKVLDIHNKLVS